MIKTMKILFLSRWYPYPSDNGSKLRIYNLLQGLAKHHDLTLLTFDDSVDRSRHAPRLEALCHSIKTVPWKPFNRNSWRARLGYLSPKPRLVVGTFSPGMAQSIEQAIATTDYDVIIASQFAMAMYSSHFCGLPAILEELELGIYYDQYVRARGWHRFRYGLTWHKHRRWLAVQLHNFKACTVVSKQEFELATRALPNYEAFEVIPNCVRADDYQEIQELPKQNTLIFTGSFSYLPNYHAMYWFLQEVYPLIQRQKPDVQLVITGKHSGYTLPDARNVTLTGYVDDVRPYLARSWASVVPIHQGGGTRLKILEAMALRVPVIATSKGAEGLELQSGKHALIADTPETFAQSTIRVLQEPELRQQLADNAYALLRDKYDWKAVTPQFLELVEKAVSAPSHL
jgi:polysaccharide biosynthesis protein PslH